MGPLQLVVPLWEVFGAGTCGRYLLHEFAKRGEVYWDAVPGDEPMGDPDTIALARARRRPLCGDISIPLVQFAGAALSPQAAFRGAPTLGYVFSEVERLGPEQIEGLRGFDVLVAGSEWNARVVRAAGFDCEAVQQGVDTDVFRPMPRVRTDDRFIIYSGGQFHHRKAQDLVIRAVKVMQERHRDVVLIASWLNLWTGADGIRETIEAGVAAEHAPILAHSVLAKLMNETDVGLFPNRFEGGTNLLLMDYMACGRPAIVNVSSGQSDVMASGCGFSILGPDDELVEQMIEALEFYYENRGASAGHGSQARIAMQAWPWSRTAEGIWKACKGVKPCETLPACSAPAQDPA